MRCCRRKPASLVPILRGVCLGQVTSLIRGHIREVRVPDTGGGEGPSVWTRATLSATPIVFLTLHGILQSIKQPQPLPKRAIQDSNLWPLAPEAGQVNVGRVRFRRFPSGTLGL